MIKEHQRVVLTTSIPEHQLQAGDIGAVVFIHQNGAGFEVEFVTLDGSESTVVEVLSEQVRPVTSKEIPHARALAGA